MAEALLAPLIGKGLMLLAALAGVAFIISKFKKSVKTEARNETLQRTNEKLADEARIENRPSADPRSVRERMSRSDL